MQGQREWGPTWVGRPKLLHPLGDKAWSDIEELVRTECRRAPPPQFRAALNEALTIFQAQRDAAEATSPKAMRANLGRADKAAKQLVSALEQLDANSRLLLSRAIRQRRPRTMRRNRSVLITGSNLLHRLSRALTIALEEAAHYPTSRAGMKDHARIELGFILALAFKIFLGEEFITTSRPDLFSEVYHELIRHIEKSLGRTPRASDLRRSLAAALERWHSTDPAVREQQATLVAQLVGVEYPVHNRR